MKHEHAPNRPSWDCGTCGGPWPCAPARTRLAAQHHDGSGVRLAMVMWDHLENFCFDQPAGPVGEMFERFISWTRHAVPARTDGPQ